MKLYHYTSIETLALILKHKTIRFSRLDRVDDPDEYSFKEDGITPAHYCYVSCWTKNDNENLPQWYMYGDSTHGVRIELDSDMFVIEGKNIVPHFFNDNFRSVYRMMAMPILSCGLLRDIQYIDDISVIKKRVFHDFVNQKAIDFKEIGIYKNNDWAFQQECRFLLQMIPLNNDEVDINYIFNSNISPKLPYIDVPIKEDCLNKIQVMLGPKVTEAEETIVSSLMQMFLNRSDYSYSYYSGKL